MGLTFTTRFLVVKSTSRALQGTEMGHYTIVGNLEIHDLLEKNVSSRFGRH